MNNSSFKTKFSNWGKKNGIHGKHAFPKYVILRFLEALQTISDDFIFKGGNLLWHYIETPRQ